MASKVKAMKLNLPGAPATWHLVTGLGYLHPDIPVPGDTGGYIKAHDEQVAAAEKAWDEHEADQEAKGRRLNGRLAFEKPTVPVEVVLISEAKADQGLEALQAHIAQARGVVRDAKRSGDEQLHAEAHNEAEVLAANEEG